MLNLFLVAVGVIIALIAVEFLRGLREEAAVCGTTIDEVVSATICRLKKVVRFR